MCFVIDKKYSKPLIAKRNIKVYKVGVVEDDIYFISAHKSFQYKNGVINKKVKLRPTKMNLHHQNSSLIHEGYHSYINVDSSDMMESYGVFIIPKGTKYYVNPYYNERVSETLIYKGELK